MRILALAGAAFMALPVVFASDAKAAAWCAWYDPYTYNCGFHTFEQCRQTISGAGGYCARNVYEWNAPSDEHYRRHRRHRSHY